MVAGRTAELLQPLLHAKLIVEVTDSETLYSPARPLNQITAHDVLAALRSGRLGGYALDPLHEAPGRDDDELLGFENVLLTPHIAAQPRFNALNDIADLLTGLEEQLK